MVTARALDGILAAWGERVFNGGAVHKVPARRGLTGLTLKSGKMHRGGSVPAQATTVRRKLAGIVKKAPQVMVRISGGGRGMRHIRAHLDYISRNGQLTVHDQNGERYQGAVDMALLRDEWQHGGFPIDDVSDRREAFNIVLSMPAGTDAQAVARAAADFARAEFGGHQYVMALHTFDTDPGREPAAQPHVHLCVKATGLDGVRLNPRKQDLQRWREDYAKALREHGVEAEATKRLHRLQRERGEKQSVRHMKARGEELHRIGRSSTNDARAVRARATQTALQREYGQLAQVLARSDDVEDRRLAIALAMTLGDRERTKEARTDRPHLWQQERSRGPEHER